MPGDIVVLNRSLTLDPYALLIVVNRVTAQCEGAALKNGYSIPGVVKNVVVLECTISVVVGPNAAFLAIVYPVTAQARAGTVVDADTVRTTARDVASLKLQTSLRDVYTIALFRRFSLGKRGQGQVR